MLARTLQHLIGQKLTSVTEVAELAGVSNSTGYRWMADRCQPDFDAVRRVIRGLPSPLAQQALLSVVVTGTNWRLQNNDLKLDLNEDGRIDSDDALDAAIRVVHQAGDSLTQVRANCADQSVTRQQLVDVIDKLNDVMRHSAVVQEILCRMAEAHHPRRKARPLPTA
jgi:transposase